MALSERVAHLDHDPQGDNPGEQSGRHDQIRHDGCRLVIQGGPQVEVAIMEVQPVVVSLQVRKHPGEHRCGAVIDFVILSQDQFLPEGCFALLVIVFQAGELDPDYPGYGHAPDGHYQGEPNQGSVHILQEFYIHLAAQGVQDRNEGQQGENRPYDLQAECFHNPCEPEAIFLDSLARPLNVLIDHLPTGNIAERHGFSPPEGVQPGEVGRNGCQQDVPDGDLAECIDVVIEQPDARLDIISVRQGVLEQIIEFFIPFV